MNVYLVWNPAEGLWKAHFNTTFEDISTLYAEVDAIQILRVEIPESVQVHRANEIGFTDMTDADQDDDGLEIERVFN